MTSHHLIPATPETVRWGLFDAAAPAVCTVNSGDTVVMETISGPPEVLPPASSGLAVPPALAAYLASNPRRGPGHMLTGPVAVSGAEPGDMLEVRIEAVELAADWGYCGFRPLSGTLPEDFPERLLSHIPVDRVRGTCKPAWGPELKLAPFFGVMGVAPPASWGAISTKEPRAHGGNIDNKELTAGSTLYLPVWAPGALFSAGDGHGLQGDGEVCVNALEIGLTGTFTLILHKKTGTTYPWAETPTHWITMGMHEDLDVAMKIALREMISLITRRSDLNAGQAYQFCSLAVDFRVTQTVNGEKGVHGMLKKDILF